MRNASQTSGDETKPTESGAPRSAVASATDLAQAAPVRPWTALLEAAIEHEVLPRLRGTWSRHTAPDPVSPLPTETDLQIFVGFLLADDLPHAQALADGLSARGVGRDQLMHGLLAAAANRLGELWSEDLCDFAVVSLGMIRLNQILRDTATHCPARPALPVAGHNALITPAPGESHNFGAAMLNDLFSRAGWQVDSPPQVKRSGLLLLVRHNWYDLVGISVSAERFLRGLPETIRTLRHAARNPDLVVLVGGSAFNVHPERAQFIGADGYAPTADAALILAQRLCAKKTQGANVTRN